MSGFKGGNRFVGGAQFKSSIRKTAGGCGGCLQVCCQLSAVSGGPGLFLVSSMQLE